MNKRILTLLSVLFIIAVMVFAFAACGHEHEFSDAWESDDTYHWHPATCDHTDETEGKEKHTFGESTITLYPTLTTAGKSSATCSVCGKTVETVIPSYSDPAHVHTYTSVTVNPTCTEQGYTKHTCPCGSEYKDNYVNANGHTADEWTSGNDSTHSGTCTVCGEVTVECTFTESVTAPGCTSQGYTTYTCNACGYSYVDDYVGATGHKFKDEYTTNDSYHWHEAICAHTSEKGEYEEHSYTSKVFEPTCTERGYTRYTCECGKYYDDDFVDELGHTVSQWTLADTMLIDETACKYIDTYSGVCSVCSSPATKTETLEKHAFYWAITTPATCEQNGVKTYICANEGCVNHTPNLSSETMEYEALEHIWELDTENSTEKVTAYKCANTACGETKRTVNSTGSDAQISDDDLNDSNEIVISDTTIGFDSNIKDNLTGSGRVDVSAGTLEGTAREEAIEKAELDPEQLAILEGRTIYNFTVSTQNQSEISDLGGIATIKIRYTLAPGETTEDIVVWYISDGKLECIDAVYSEDAEGNGYVTFTTSHFSYYTVAELTPAERCAKDGHERATFAPTCTEGGYTVCHRCGEILDTFSPVGHNWHSAITSPAGCTENGVMTHTCSTCNATYEQTIVAMGHNYVLTSHTEPTCLVAGTSVYSCVYCSDSFTRETPVKSHEFAVAVIPATCQDRGFTVKICTLCGTSVTTDYVPKIAHTFGTTWLANEAGHYNICTVCGEAGTVAAHTPGAAATEQSAQTCTDCGYVIAPPVQHVHSLTKVDAKAPDCTNGGNVEYYICACGTYFEDANAENVVTDVSKLSLKANGHTSVDVPAVAPGCTTVGYTAGTSCSVCGEVLSGQVELSAKGHSFTINVTAPDCENEGYTEYSCACGEEYIADRKQPLGHKYMSAVTAPDCENEGFTTHTCARCGDEYTDSEKDALGHNFGTKYEFNENGHYYSCTRCNETTEVEAHTADYTEATEEHGVTCTACGYKIAEALPHTHTPVKTVAAKEATCTTSGNIEYFVCKCGARFYDEECSKAIANVSDTVIKALGHNIINEKAVEPTCTSFGYTEASYCDRCGYSIIEKQQIPMTDHNYKDGACTECGAADPSFTPDKPEIKYVYDNGYVKAEFYSDGTLVATQKYHDETGNIVEETMKGIWYEREGFVFGDIGGDVAKFTVDANGNLTMDTSGEGGGDVDKITVVYVYTNPYVRVEFYSDGTMIAYEKYTDDATGEIIEEATKGTWYQDGGSVFATLEGETIEFNFDENGNLIIKGEGGGGGDVVDKAILYTFEGGNIYIEFYHDYTLTIFLTDMDGMAMNGEWKMEKNLITAIVMEEPMNFLVDENGKLTIQNPEGTVPETCKHENKILSARREPTCQFEGFEEYYCPDCHNSVSTILPTIPHNYVEGVCTECGLNEKGEIDGEVIYYIEEVDEYSSGKDVYKYNFYESGIVSMQAFSYDLEGKITAESGLQTAKWEERNQFICIVFDGRVTAFFTVAEDGYNLEFAGEGDDVPLYIFRMDINHGDIKALQTLLFYENGSGNINIHMDGEEDIDVPIEWMQSGNYVVFAGRNAYPTAFEIVDGSNVLVLYMPSGDQNTCKHEGLLEVFYDEGNCYTAEVTAKYCLECGYTEHKEGEYRDHIYYKDGFCANCAKPKDVTAEEWDKTLEYFYLMENGDYHELYFYSDYTALALAMGADGMRYDDGQTDWMWNNQGYIQVGNMLFDVLSDGFTLELIGYCSDEEPDDPNIPGTDEETIYYKDEICCFEFYPDNILWCEILLRNSAGDIVGRETYNGKWKHSDNGIYAYVENLGEIYFFFDEDGNLQRESEINVCAHEKREEIEVCPPTCTEEGYARYYCPECNTEFTQYLGWAAHNFVDGVCTECGMMEEGGGDIEIEVKVIYFVESDTMNLKFLSDYTVTGTYVVSDSATGESFVKRVIGTWYSTGEKVIATLDNGTEWTFYITADGLLVFGEENVCNHKNYYVESTKDATCTDAGYEVRVCNDCNRSFTVYTYAMGHKYGDDGVCTVCGEKPSEEAIEYVVSFNDAIIRFMNNKTFVATVKIYGTDGAVIEESLRGKWEHTNDGVIAYFDNGEKMQFFFGDDGNLYPEEAECTHPNNEEIYRFEGNCYQEGYVEYECPDCNEKITIYTGFTDHNMVDGVCSVCGYFEEGEEDYLKFFYYSDELSIECYSDFTISGKAQTLIDGKVITRKLSGSWTMDDEKTVIVYVDGGEKIIFFVNEDKSLTLAGYDCSHDNIEVTETVESTCTVAGYIRNACPSCGYYYDLPLDILPHDFVDGVCTVCGFIEGREVIHKVEGENYIINLYLDNTVDGTMNITTADGAVIKEAVSGSWTRTEVGITVTLESGEELYLIYNEDGFVVPDDSGTEKPVCNHENVKDRTFEGSCVEESFVVTVCIDCGETLRKANTGYIADHNYIDGVCTGCGAMEEGIGSEEEIVKKLLYTYEQDGLVVEFYDGYTLTATAYMPNENGEISEQKFDGTWKPFDGGVAANINDAVQYFYFDEYGNLQTEPDSGSSGEAEMPEEETEEDIPSDVTVTLPTDDIFTETTKTVNSIYYETEYEGYSYTFYDNGVVERYKSVVSDTGEEKLDVVTGTYEISEEYLTVTVNEEEIWVPFA